MHGVDPGWRANKEQKEALNFYLSHRKYQRLLGVRASLLSSSEPGGCLAAGVEGGSPNRSLLLEGPGGFQVRAEEGSAQTKSLFRF